MLEHQLRSRRAFDEQMRKNAAKPAHASAGQERPPPTDDDLDLAWLATPWSTIRKLTGATTDDEAQSMLTQALAGRSPTVS